MKKWFFLSFVLSGTSLFALLPPLCQSAKEIDALVQHEELYGLLPSGEMIQEIRHLPTGYEVITQHYRLEVDCVYKSQTRPGPAEFELQFHEPEARAGIN